MLTQYWKKEQRQRIKIGHRRAHGDQDIHIGALIFKALESVDIIIPSGIELNRCGQQPEKPIYPGRMAPGTNEVKIPGHAQYKQGQGKDDAYYKFAGLIPYLCLPRNLFGIFFVCGVFGCNNAVTGGFNGPDHLLEIDNARNVFYDGTLAGKICTGLNNP